MSNAIQKVETPRAVQVGRGERLEVSTANAKQLMVKPIRILPEDLRPVMFKFWLFWKMLKGMESPISFCVALAHWIDTKGLRHDDAVRVLQSTMDPTKVSNIEYGSQLLAVVGQEVQDQLRRREWEAAEQERRRRQAEDNAKPKATAEELEAWRKMRAEFAAKTETV